jgi:hypothetical protein
MTRRPNSSRAPAVDRYAQRFLQLKNEMRNVEYFCKGTVLERRMKCGQPACACHTDSAKRHGPYWEWTYKAKGKTVNVRLSAEAGPLFKTASRQHRKIKSLLARLERLSQNALKALAKANTTESAKNPSPT